MSTAGPLKPDSTQEQRTQDKMPGSPTISTSSQQPKYLQTPGLSKNPFMQNRGSSSKFSVAGSPLMSSVGDAQSNQAGSCQVQPSRGRCVSAVDKLQFLHTFASPQHSPVKKSPNLLAQQLEEQTGGIVLRNSVEEGPGRRLKSSKLFSMDFKKLEAVPKSGFVLQEGVAFDNSALNIQKKGLDSHIDPLSGIWSASKAEIGSKLKSEANSEKKASSITFGVPRRFKGVTAAPAITSGTIIESFMKDI